MDYNKIEKQIKLQVKMRNSHWVTQQQNKGRLFIKGIKVTDEIFNQFRTTIRTTQEIYENAWDVDIQIIPLVPDVDADIPRKERRVVLSIDIRGIVLYFPRVTITNRERKSHLIKDIFVRIPLVISDSRLKIEIIEGGRTTLSYAEYCSHYYHSHLSINAMGSISSRSVPPMYSTFCTGSGEINIYQSDINAEGISEARLTSYLMQIMTVVGYESIEGTPYRHIRNIMIRDASGRRSNPNDNTSNNLYNRVLNYYKQEKKTPCLEFALESGKYIVKDNEKFDEFLMTQVITDDDKKAILCMIDETGAYYQYGSTPTREIPPVVQNKYIFQGNEISFTIEDIPSEVDESNIEYSIHPNIKKYIKNKIEYDINKKSIRKSTIDRYSNQVSNARKSVQPDKILVPANS
jgi:hypothetical protein